MGRPSSFTPEIAEAICRRMSAGESLRQVCEDPAMPPKGTVLRWLRQNEAFRAQYEEAREDLLEHWAEDIVDISDNGKDAKRDRLRCDSRKWLLSKLAPKKYGERLLVDSRTTQVPATADDLVREAAAMGLTPEQLFGRRPAE